MDKGGGGIHYKEPAPATEEDERSGACGRRPEARVGDGEVLARLRRPRDQGSGPCRLQRKAGGPRPGSGAARQRGARPWLALSCSGLRGAGRSPRVGGQLAAVKCERPSPRISPRVRTEVSVGTGPARTAGRSCSWQERGGAAAPRRALARLPLVQVGALGSSCCDRHRGPPCEPARLRGSSSEDGHLPGYRVRTLTRTWGTQFGP